MWVENILFVRKISERKERERKILIRLYSLAKELSNLDYPKLYELGHYLTDNLISKICMLIAKENNQKFTKTTKNGNERTLSFHKLYNGILKKNYPDAPDYNELESLHNERNIYQHEFSSITDHFNKRDL